MSSIDRADVAATQPPSGSEFHDHCRSAMVALRTALADLYRAVQADPDRPQEVSRQFKLDKSLTWKISKLLRSDDPIAVVAVVPGNEGMARLLAAMTARGAGSDLTDRVREAMREFDAMVRMHAGDRATLDLFLDSMHPPLSMQESRRLAFLGNSGILGLQTHVRFATRFMKPNHAVPEKLDFVLVTGMRRLRRLRPIPTWPIYRFMNFRDDLTPEAMRREIEPLAIGGAGGRNDWLMPAFCSKPIPELNVRSFGKTLIYELVAGPVGRTGEVDLTFGYIDRASVSRYATPNDTFGQFATGVATPAEWMLLDIFVHRSMPEVESMTAQLATPVPGFAAESGMCTLPIEIAFERLPGDLDDLSTPLVDDYAQLVGGVFSSEGWDPSEFYAMRLLIEHPPLHANVLSSYRLPEAPRA